MKIKIEIDSGMISLREYAVRTIAKEIVKTGIKEKQIWYNEAAIQTELENAEVGRLVRCWLKMFGRFHSYVLCNLDYHICAERAGLFGNAFDLFPVRIRPNVFKKSMPIRRNAGNWNAISVFREKRFNKPGFDAILNGVKEIVVVVGLFKFKLVGWRCFRVIQQEVVHIVFLVRNEIAIVVIVCVLFCAKHNGADAIHV